MKTYTYIRVHTTFEGVHNYPIAPAGVTDLRSLHRHIFHVRLKVSVTHDDRELEFFLVKHQIDKVIRELYSTDDKQNEFAPAFNLGAKSCEMMAKDIYKALFRDLRFGERECEIEVSEDDNNAAIVFFVPTPLILDI